VEFRDFRALRKRAAAANIASSLSAGRWACRQKRHGARPKKPPASDPAEEIAALQDVLYDLMVTRIAQTRPHELRSLRRDAHEAAALAQELADLVLGIDDDDPRLT
jgi:hypothetical protein